MKRSTLGYTVLLLFLVAAIAGCILDPIQEPLRTDPLCAERKTALRAGQCDGALALLEAVFEQEPGCHEARDLLAQALDASMVDVPAGEFLMGSDTGDIDERPERRVYLAAFAIDRFEVTNVQYQRFLLSTGHKPPQRWPERYAALLPDRDPYWHGAEYPAGETMHPVVGVNWEDAVVYCAWADKRLPSEAEWEKAARGADGRMYPWGDEWQPGKANSGETGSGYTQPVGTYRAGISPHGALDMSGNAWEWVADPYDRQYYTYAPDHNPLGPESGTGERVLRGGAWDSAAEHLRVSYRNATHCFGPNYRAGFRCAKSSGP
jgi:formylglycine-generating enzyme required for sulfatase activity